MPMSSAALYDYYLKPACYTAVAARTRKKLANGEDIPFWTMTHILARMKKQRGCNIPGSQIPGVKSAPRKRTHTKSAPMPGNRRVMARTKSAPTFGNLSNNNQNRRLMARGNRNGPVTSDALVGQWKRFRKSASNKPLTQAEVNKLLGNDNNNNNNLFAVVARAEQNRQRSR